MVAIDLDQLASGTKQYHGSKLVIDAATKNQFVAIWMAIGCTVTP